MKIKLFVTVATLAVCRSLIVASGLPEFIPVKPYPLKGDIPGFPTPPGKTAIVVGMAHFTTSIKPEKLQKDLKKVARMHGLEHFRGRAIKVWQAQVPFNIPRSIEYYPVTTYNTSSASIYSPYAGYVGAVYGNGMSTSSVPVVDPGMSGVRNITRAEILVEFVVWK